MLDQLLEWGLNRVPIWLCLAVSVGIGLWAAKGWMEKALDGESHGWDIYRQYIKGLVALCGLVGSLWAGCVYGFGRSLASIDSNPAREIIEADLPAGSRWDHDDEYAKRLMAVLKVDGVTAFRNVGCGNVLGERAAVLRPDRKAWADATPEQRRALIDKAQERWQQVTRVPFDEDAPVYVDAGDGVALILGGSHRGPGRNTWLLDDPGAPLMLNGPYDIHHATDDELRQRKIKPSDWRRD